MAKFVGSYAHLSGGTEPFAFMALTGFPLVHLGGIIGRFNTAPFRWSPTLPRYIFQRPAADKDEILACTARFKHQLSPHSPYRVRTAALRNHWQWRGAQYAACHERELS